MTGHPPPDRGAVAAADRPGRTRAWRWRLPPVPVRVVGYAAAAWCLAFAGVSAWQVAGLTGQPDPRGRYAAYAAGLAIIGVLVGVLKLAGAAVALAAVLVRPGRGRRPLWLLGAALWGGVWAAWPVLGREPGHHRRDGHRPAGAVGGLDRRRRCDAKAVGYVLFFLVGAALFGVLAVWFHRRHQLRWTAAVAGLAGAPLLLGLLLAAAPAILGRWGLLPPDRGG